MSTTIWLSQETKRKLDDLKTRKKESYEDVIYRLIQKFEELVGLKEVVTGLRREQEGTKRFLELFFPDHLDILEKAVAEVKKIREQEEEEANLKALEEEEKMRSKMKLPRPTKAEILKARKLHETYLEAERKGQKTFIFEGKKFRILGSEEKETQST